MAKRQRKFFINEKKAISLFKEMFGFRAVVMNWYQIRIQSEESRAFYDWYHTQGTTVRSENGTNRNFGIFGDPEDLANAILDDVCKG